MLRVNDKQLQVDVRHLKSRLSATDPRVKKHMLRLGQNQRRYILDRTRRGIDYKGKPWPRLSERYADYKAGFGEGRVTATMGIADLNLTGNMIKSLGVRITSPGTFTLQGGITGVTLHAELWDRHQEGRGVPRRAALGFNPEDIRRHEIKTAEFLQKVFR